MSVELTQRERDLIVAYEWLANVTHQNHHSAEHGSSRSECPTSTCRYATEVLRRAREADAIGVVARRDLR